MWFKELFHIDTLIDHISIRFIEYRKWRILLILIFQEEICIIFFLKDLGGSPFSKDAR